MNRVAYFVKILWRWRHFPLACLLGLFISFEAMADDGDWSLQSWLSDNGLPNNNVTSLAQTDDGYLWVATTGHFARFDGVHFEEFTPHDALPAFNGPLGRVSTFLKDSQGGLWLAMIHGPIVRLKSGTAQIFTNNLPDYIVQAMVEDKEGAIWVTYHGNVVCRIKEGKTTRFTSNDGLPNRYDCTLTVDRLGRIWFAKDGQVGRFDTNHFNVLNKTLGRNVRLACATTGGIWICSGRELFKCDDAGVVTSAGTFRPDVSGTDPTSLLEDKSGAVWIGTAADGLFRFDGSIFEKISSSHPYISSLLQDREGNLWVGTGGGGLDMIRPRAFTLENEKTGLPFGAVQSVCQDITGNIWATTASGLLACRTNESWFIVSAGTNWPGGRATCVAADREGAIWIGTQNHVLYRLDGDHFTSWRTQQGFSGHVVRGLLADTNGDVWMVEEEPDVVQRFHGGQFDTINLPAAAGVPRGLCKDTKGNLWIGTSKGFLLRIANGIISDETTNVSHFYTSIRTLAVTPDGSLWIGYAGWGLGRFKDGHFARISGPQGLFNSYLSQIVPDGQGWLWFGSDRGIFKAKENDLDDVAEGRAQSVLCVHYGEGNALPSLQASFGVTPNVLHSSNNRLWFPTLSALAVVDLDNLQEDSQPPPVLLKQVVMDDKIIASYGGPMPVTEGIDLRAAGTKLRLPPNHHRLEFDFTALCFSAPENVHFQCRLVGIDDDWVNVTGPWNISYSRLAAGNYQFLLRAQNGDTPWSQASAVKLDVLPFFWETWWFRSATLLLFTAAIIAVVRYVSFRRLRMKLHTLEQQAALDKERSRIAKDIHDDLGGSLTQIKLLFELTQRNRSTPDKVERLGQEGLAATRQIIKSMDEIVWAVNPRNDSLPHLVDYLGQFAIEFLSRAGIRCRVDLPDYPVAWAISPEVRHNLFLAVKEALNNVIQHAGANEVWLRITAINDVLTIIIEDNGHGFNGKTNGEFADGLPNMSQRMAEIGGRSNIESTAEKGTRVFLIFPKPN
ncbi:MAG TPA: two-component regulator propeller domain-containing protein [Pseudomonadales bacterium]|nr:two-component regulator propeller domain-containing protein [Pseudomonadales bacterium]